MTRFAFIIHPLSVADIARKRKYFFVRYLPQRWVERALMLKGPELVSEITGIRSATGATTEGWLVGCPLTARQLVEEPADRCIDKVVQCGELAQKLGAEIVGLGAFTSVVGDAGITVAQRLEIGLTTGNSYTIATAVEGALEAAALVGIETSAAPAAVIGASGSIGKACIELLAPSVAELWLAAKPGEDVRPQAEEIAARHAIPVHACDSVDAALSEAQIILAVSAAVQAIIHPDMLRPGAVVCDVARPRDVSRQVVEERPDVLVIEGGAVAVPGNVDFHFDFGFPPGLSYACMAETMILALEGRTEDYSLGRDINLEQVHEISGLAGKHGFKLAGFRCFEKTVTEEQIARVREAVAKRV